MKIIVIDNYDSFTYNLVHYLEELKCEVTVKRNDQVNIKEIEKFDKIVLSPGPGIPKEAGLLKEIISSFFNFISLDATIIPQLLIKNYHHLVNQMI